MSLKIALGLGKRIDVAFATVHQKMLNWILAENVWDDTSQWIDTETWND